MITTFDTIDITKYSSEEIREAIERNNKIIADKERFLKNDPVLPDVLIRGILALHKENAWLRGELKKREEK